MRGRKIYKLTESAVAEGDGMTLGEWVREVLLERADVRKPSVIEETLLGEVLERLTANQNRKPTE